MKKTAADWLKIGAVGLAGLVAGGVVAGTVSANAEDTAAGTSEAPAPGRGVAGPPMGARDLSQPQRSDEELLADDITAKVKGAALAEYPGATVVRIESDSDGVYEAHLAKADGSPVTVEVDKSFEVTGEEQFGPGGPHGHGMPGGPPRAGWEDEHEEGGNNT